MVDVRRARPDDFDRIVAVVDEWWGRTISPLLPRLFLDHFHSTSQVAEDETGLAGFLIGFISPSRPDEAYIHFVGVRPDLRRSGLARALYDGFADYARDQGCRVLRAITGPGNTGSIRFHEELGFVASAPIADYDGAGQDRVTFRRDLIGPDIEIRRATPAEVGVVCDIYLRSRTAAGAAFPPGVHSPAEVRDYVARVLVPTRETWLAYLGDVPVGVLVLDGDDVDWLFVTPDAQSRGVGAALLHHARRVRPDGLALWTFVSNAAARRFYERHGFAAVRETDGEDNEEHAPDIRYVWGEHPER
jgi:GNAT superfamily N-acetyltransferase